MPGLGGGLTDIHTKIDLTPEGAESLQAFQAMFYSQLFAMLTSYWGGMGLNSTDVATLRRLVDGLVVQASHNCLCEPSDLDVEDPPVLDEVLTEMQTAITDVDAILELLRFYGVHRGEGQTVRGAFQLALEEMVRAYDRQEAEGA